MRQNTFDKSLFNLDESAIPPSSRQNLSPGKAVSPSTGKILTPSYCNLLKSRHAYNQVNGLNSIESSNREEEPRHKIEPWEYRAYALNSRGYKAPPFGENLHYLEEFRLNSRSPNQDLISDTRQQDLAGVSFLSGTDLGEGFNPLIFNSPDSFVADELLRVN